MLRVLQGNLCVQSPACHELVLQNLLPVHLHTRTITERQKHHTLKRKKKATRFHTYDTTASNSSRSPYSPKRLKNKYTNHKFLKRFSSWQKILPSTRHYTISRNKMTKKKVNYRPLSKGAQCCMFIQNHTVNHPLHSYEFCNLCAHRRHSAN